MRAPAPCTPVPRGTCSLGASLGLSRPVEKARGQSEAKIALNPLKSTLRRGSTRITPQLKHVAGSRSLTYNQGGVKIEISLRVRCTILVSGLCCRIRFLEVVRRSYAAFSTFRQGLPARVACEFVTLRQTGYDTTLSRPTQVPYSGLPGTAPRSFPERVNSDGPRRSERRSHARQRTCVTSGVTSPVSDVTRNSGRASGRWALAAPPSLHAALPLLSVFKAIVFVLTPKNNSQEKSNMDTIEEATHGPVWVPP